MQKIKEEQKEVFATHLRNLRIADLELFITAAHLKNLGQAASLHHLMSKRCQFCYSTSRASFWNTSMHP